MPAANRTTAPGSGPPSRASRPGARAAALTAGGAALVLAAGVAIVAYASPKGHAAPVSAVSHAASTPRPAAAALRLVSVTPAAGAQGVNGTAPVQLRFSAPVAARSPMPQLSPAIPGHWRIRGTSVMFIPATGYMQDTRVTLTIPGGTSGMISAAGASAGAGGQLASTVTRSFTTGAFSTLRLQQLLAQLGYLPFTWTSLSGSAINPADARAELSAAYDPPAGGFNWQGAYPWTLTSQWRAGSPNILDVGAIRAFEADHGMTMDGSAGPAVWSRLLAAVATGQDNQHGYTYAIADQNLPESLTLWHDGRVVLKSPVNTGISASPTVDGTFPVYLRYYFQVMKGTNPDGSKYADPVWYVAYFDGGDAVHYFPRYSFGWNQSLGCVELPWDQARQAWPYLSYGSLVTVTGPVGG
ncbi:MAG: L,D-transpeptidase family protein [Streptosporangiaceae bacterium]|nr:L,D-transpeptidase family protein [Streptosporangiaceae bacterium]